MAWCDEVLGLRAHAAITGLMPDDLSARLATLPMEDLVRGWRELSRTGLKDRTPGTHAFLLYFDRISYDTPDRALEFLEAELAGETDDAVVALLAQGKLLGQLLHFHAPRVAPALQELALRQPRLRWLMGGTTWSIRGGMVEDEEAKRILLSICDEQAFNAWREAHRAGAAAIDFAAWLTTELAPLWVAITARSDLDKERDDNASALFDYQYEPVNNNPLRALDLVTAIVSIEDNPNVLGLLAAGTLQDLLPAEDGPVIDAVVAEAERSPRFRELLCGAGFSGLNADVIERLDKARS